MTAHELACNEFVELVTEYLEGTLPPADRQRFEAHMAQCDGCDTYFAQMRRTIDVLGRLPEEAVPQTAWDRLLGEFRNWWAESQENPPDNV